MARAAPAEHFQDLEKQAHAARLGMWIFLASELMLFAGLFTLYGAYRTARPDEFALAAKHAKVAIGTINTFILLTSSFVVAMAVAATRRGARRAAAALLFGGVALGAAFLALKAVEYAAHVREGIVPGPGYRFAEAPTPGARTFFTLYYVMTGLHSLHVAGGMAVLAWVGARSWRGAYGRERSEHVPVELATLYWHLVDIIWIFLWPLFYLLR